VRGIAAEPVRVMVLVTDHMDNPGRDLHNVSMRDVLEPECQAEIARVALARFKPTAVHVEASAQWASEHYALFVSGKLEPSRNEIVQLGFRLARLVGLEAAHGIDVMTDFPYGPVEEFAAVHDMRETLDALHARIESEARQHENLLNTHGIVAGLRQINDPAHIRKAHDHYRCMLRFGSGDLQPGAELLAAWYRRNFLIFANLLQLGKPGDRIAVIYGSGHAFLLRQCVIETPGFELVEANDYLPPG